MLRTHLIIVFSILCGLVVLGVIVLIRGFVRGIRQRGPSLPYVPVKDPNPPEPVVRTPWMVVVAWTAIGWAAINVALAVAVWHAAERWGLGALPRSIVAVYVVVAAILAGIGGAMMLGQKAYGRRMISWGHFLLSLVAFIGGVVALLLPGREKVPAEIRAGAYYMAIALGAHLILSTVIGSMAQHAGKPVSQTPPAQ